jgi:hypothetical protein
MDWLMDLLGLNKGKGTIDAANQNMGVISGLENQLGGIINSTSAEQQGHLGNANSLASLGPNANGILGDIYGLNGQQGSANARSMFQEAPGYQYNLDQSEQALMRHNAALGQLQSGDTSMDLQRNAIGLADQGWGDWINGITGGIDRQIGTLGDMATQAGQVGATRMGVAGDIGTARMGANNQVGAGKEAGQGSLWEMLGNVAGVAGSAFGLGGGGFGKPAAPAMSGMAPRARLGYGGGF